MKNSKNHLIDNEFLLKCKSILSKIDGAPKIYVQTPLFFDEELFPVQVLYKGILFEAKCVDNLYSLLNVYVFFINQKVEVFKENSIYQIEIEKDLKIRSEDINRLKKEFNVYKNIKKDFPKISIKNKLVNHKIHFYTTLYDSNFVSDELEVLSEEIKVYHKKRKQIEELISNVEAEFSFSFEKQKHKLKSEFYYVFEYKDVKIIDNSYNQLIKKLKYLLSLIAGIKKIVNQDVTIIRTENDKVFKIRYLNREIVGKQKKILKELLVLAKYNVIQLSIKFN